MDNRTIGAWIIQQSKKIQNFNNAYDFGDIELAGKCGIFLSHLAASNEISELNKETVEAIAKVSGIRKTELKTVIEQLSDAKLIDTTSNGSLAVLGITTESVLSHTTGLFNKNEPDSFQKASLRLSEFISDKPVGDKLAKEFISDEYNLAQEKIDSLFNQSEYIGLIDSEPIDEIKYYFNGNLFRRDNIQKTNAVLDSLSSQEVAKIQSLDSDLTEYGCVPMERASQILGKALLSKLQAIGMYDCNEISNSTESKTYLTKPSAFSKHGSPFEEDALDMAKAFVSSLYYGMTESKFSRGRIMQLKVLMQKLINGGEVGPATAIGEDYKLLEIKRVVQIRKESGGGRFYMKLLKRDIGEIAMQVLEKGDATEASLMSHGSVTSYRGPEENRLLIRRKTSSQSESQITNMLRTFRN